MRGRGYNTLTPFFIELDDLVDEVDVGETTPLRFPDDVWSAAFLHPEEIDVQHSLSLSK